MIAGASFAVYPGLPVLLDPRLSYEGFGGTSWNPMFDKLGVVLSLVTGVWLCWFAIRRLATPLIAWLVNTSGVLQALIRITAVSIATGTILLVLLVLLMRGVAVANVGGGLRGINRTLNTLWLYFCALGITLSVALWIVVPMLVALRSAAVVLLSTTSAVRGLLWRVVEYERGSLAALLLLATVALALAELYLRTI